MCVKAVVWKGTHCEHVGMQLKTLFVLKQPNRAANMAVD